MGTMNRFNPGPALRPLLNIGFPFDILTGRYIKGKHGENILNGGQAHITGIGGRGNTYKTTIALHMLLTILDRYTQAEGFVYDTEISLTYARLHQLARHMLHLGQLSLEDSERFLLTDKTVMIGNEWFDNFREIAKERRANPKDIMLTTPFIDRKGEYIPAFNPLTGLMDSLSQMDVQVVETMYDKSQVGESGLNVEALKGAAAKAQMITQLPGLTGSAGIYLMMSAHMGDEHQLDPYAPSTKKLTFLKGNVKFKRVPEPFTFLTNNCWFCSRASVLVNKTTKAPEFPLSKDDDLKGDTDLMVVTLQNLRGKSGPTGMPIDVVVSQREGLQRGLSAFWYLKNNNKYGIGGNDRSYYVELRPDVTLQRTTVRPKINEDRLLQRALEITAEMCQIRNLWHDYDRDLLIEPSELYSKIKEKGYDWDILLNTRGYWMFNEDVSDDTLPFLSTMDLLELAAGRYEPWWYKDIAGKSTKSTDASSKE